MEVLDHNKLFIFAGKRNLNEKKEDRRNKQKNQQKDETMKWKKSVWGKSIILWYVHLMKFLLGRELIKINLIMKLIFHIEPDF